jgi:hypothetical protein
MTGLVQRITAFEKGWELVSLASVDDGNDSLAIQWIQSTYHHALVWCQTDDAMHAVPEGEALVLAHPAPVMVAHRLHPEGDGISLLGGADLADRVLSPEDALARPVARPTTQAHLVARLEALPVVRLVVLHPAQDEGAAPPIVRVGAPAVAELAHQLTPKVPGPKGLRTRS